MSGWYFRQQPHPPPCPHVAGSVPGCVWPCSACGGCDPSFSIEHPYTGSVMAKALFQLRQGCCTCASAWKVEIQAWMFCVPAPFSQFLAWVKQGHWARDGCSARLKAEPGLHPKACVPSSPLQCLCPDCRGWKYFQSIK